MATAALRPNNRVWALEVRVENDATGNFAETLCANMTETSCMTAISEGGKENQHGIDERFFPARHGCGGSI